MDYEKLVAIRKLVAICRHELRLQEEYDITRLTREVKIVQDDSSETYAGLTKQQRIKAREIMSGYMLAWEYLEGLDGSGPGQRLWKEKMSRPDALIWPEDKKKILAGVEKMFNELQDYSIIDRQKRKSRPIPAAYHEADAGYDSSPPVVQSTVRPPTKQGRRREKQPKTDVSLVLDHAAPIVRDTELSEQDSSPIEEPKKAVSKSFYDAVPDTQQERPVTDVAADDSRSRKRKLTPPYIPEKGLHQTWPAFGFKNVSKEGVRTLRDRTQLIKDSKESPSATTDMTPHTTVGSRVKANRKQGSAEKYFAQRREEDHIDDQDSKRTRKGRLPRLPKSLLTRHQAVSANPIENRSPTSEDRTSTREASPSSDGSAPPFKRFKGLRNRQ